MACARCSKPLCTCPDSAWGTGTVTIDDASEPGSWKRFDAQVTGDRFMPDQLEREDTGARHREGSA